MSHDSLIRSFARSFTFAVAVAACSLTHAAPIYQSATYVPGITFGYSIYGDDDDFFSFVGAAFNLTRYSTVTSLGGVFDGSNGTLFGEIIALGSVADRPAMSLSDLPSRALASVVFAPADGDQTIALPQSIELAPGAYAVLFGTGAFGASGSFVDMTQGQNPIDISNLFQYTDGGVQPIVGAFNAVSLSVVGQVPEPPTYAILALGLCALLATATRRRQPGFFTTDRDLPA